MTRNEKFARWMGWTDLNTEDGITCGTNPNLDADLQEKGRGQFLIPDYENSIDACMELVAKVRAMGWEFTLETYQDDWYRATFGHEKLPMEAYTPHSSDTNPALAICAAVEDVMEESQ